MQFTEDELEVEQSQEQEQQRYHHPGAMESTSPLARMASMSNNNRFFGNTHSRPGKQPVRSRPIATPSASCSNVPTMPIPIPTNPNVIPGNTLPSAPASPPTPAPSPTPMSRAPDWSKADPREDIGLLDLDDGDEHFSASATSSARGYGFGYRHMRGAFADMDNEERQRMLAELLNMCDGKLLGFVANFVGPRLKRDPFSVLPNELCLRILTFIEDARTLARSSQVSRRWRELVSDDMAWKSLCERHAYRRMSDGQQSRSHHHGSGTGGASSQRPQHPYGYFAQAQSPTLMAGLSSSAPDLTRHMGLTTTPPSMTPAQLRSPSRSNSSRHGGHRPKAISYRSHFKQRYQVETAWRHGGHVDTRQITPDQGVVTSLHLTSTYIIVALDNAKIHVFDTSGRHLRCLQGHVMGVWAMVPCGDTLVSGGCDRDVRVWDLTTGMAVHMLRGHTSTVRCLKMSGTGLAISGSRDTTLRVWDVKKGVCKHVLVGHQASVRCLAIHGDVCVSGSYDTTARVWSISEGRCLRTLQGHFSQIYAIAFDGRRVATGSLDTSVRVWDPRDGRCLAQLQGHTSLVGQLQLRGDTLVTGGSDGSVRVWSLKSMSAVHRLAAHDNSVTSLQFDESRIVSGGSDGRVKVWDLRTGVLVRELGVVAEAVWRVVFEDEKAVVLASRGGKTVMEVWSFAPPSEDGSDEIGRVSHVSSPGPSIYHDDHRSSSYRSLDTSNLANQLDEGHNAERPTVSSSLRVGRTHRETSEMLLLDQGDAVMEDVFDPLRGFGGAEHDDESVRVQSG
ncbi:related to Cdc4 and related F-box and WD-40 proteins [Ramularia collo-cygni]|uniref:Mitochondrial division protein 1 n=1 Tax=Ramularia collo-cygni TaxID=112498 RepID=A0A2D3VSJ3_9PEZI|nr:related to Cdc4 and related F-box and WD-40 proteins [Ramularia collo-cygni]CZT25633.1 related to Cdc4 and related F-box and WD-40 proteins [Ramularia collo-cygni]